MAAEVFENVYALSQETNDENRAFSSMMEAFRLYKKLNEERKAAFCYQKAKEIFPNSVFFEYYFK